MQFPNLKNSFLAFILVAIASFSTACSTASSENQSQASNTNTTATNANDKQGMNHHGGMHHGGTNHSMEMDLGAADANYDLRFVDAMILHHQGAVEMAAFYSWVKRNTKKSIPKRSHRY